MMDTRDSTDVIIVGAGPAGLATAIAARQKGLRAIVAEASEPPLDKACGEGLLPVAVEASRLLGVRLDLAAGFPLRGIRFVQGDIRVEAAFPSVPGLGMRRTTLYRLLLDRAVEAGVSFIWKAPVTGLHPQGVSVGGHLVRARWVIGADGCHSRMRKWAGLDGAWFHGQRFGFRRHFRVAPWSDHVEIYWGPFGQVYATPLGGEEVCVALISRSANLRLSQALPMFPELQNRLRGAEAASAERGAVSATRIPKRVFRGRLALVGDASGAVDAISGEGICLSFCQALELASALTAGDLSLYQRAHRRLARRPLAMTALLLSLDRCSAWRHCVLRALSWNPAIFARLLAMHVSLAVNPEFASGVMLPPACEMLRSPNP